MDMNSDINDRAERLRNDIIEFIEAHPGAIKQELDHYIINKGSGSKKTIQRELKFLMEEENSVYVDKDKPNSARHRLFINPDSEIRAVLSDLAKVKQAFFILISQVKNVSDTIENWGKDDYERNDSLDADDPHKVLPDDVTLAHSSLRVLFEHTLVIYLLHFLFEWPKKVPDSKNLDRLYLLAFQTIKEIRTELSNSLPHRQEFEPVFFQDKFVTRLMSLRMDPVTLCAAIMNLDKLGTHEQTASLVDTLWKFGSSFSHTSDEDWKAEVELVETLTTKKMTKKMRDRFRRESLFR
jgi:hypothetical protein